jgi:hypothetical protein
LEDAGRKPPPRSEPRGQAPGVRAGREAPRVEVKALGGGRFTLLLVAELGPLGLGRLTAALAAKRVGISAGTARRSGPWQWRAELSLEAVAGGADPAALDYAALLDEPAPTGGLDSSFIVTGYRIERARGELIVEVAAQDALGFLDRVLRAFAFLSAFPSEVTLSTRSGEVRDVFCLHGIGGKPPSAEVEAELRRMLRDRCAAGAP